MSTEFGSRLSGELAFVRFARRNAEGVGPSFEFGTMSNFEEVCRMLDAGDTFEGLGAPVADDVVSRAQLEALVVEDRVTFGVFPVTVEVGSGEMFRFSVETD